jgi:hypothetical protein
MAQAWPLSQLANKQSGTCSVCFAVRQLHIKEGTVHRHGPRSSPCPGSDKLPLKGGSSQTQTAPSNVCNSCNPVSQSVDSILSNSIPKLSPVDDPTFASTQLPGNQLPDFMFAFTSVPVIKHIPKSARAPCASHLSALLDRVVVKPSELTAWTSLMRWSQIVLPLPKRGGKKHNITSVVKKRIDTFSALVSQSGATGDKVERRSKSREEGTPELLAEAIASKLEDGNIRAAVRLLCSDDTPAPISRETLEQLKSKHPVAPPDRPTALDPSGTVSLAVDEQSVLKAMKSFPTGSSGGTDGLRPRHIVDLLNNKEKGPGLLTSLTAFVNLLLSGTCHPDIRPFLFGGRLIALQKKSGGIRPIAIGFSLRRLAAKCANMHAVRKLGDFFGPIQFSVGVPGGCEAVVHSCRPSSQCRRILLWLN